MSARATYTKRRGYRVGYVGTSLVMETSTRWRESSCVWVEPETPQDGTFYATENEARTAFLQSGCGAEKHFTLIPTRL